MAVDACNCTDGTKGWGLSSCFNKFGYPLGYAFQKIKDSGGNDNSFAGPINQNDWEDAMYAKDQSEQLLVLTNVRAVTDEREDPNTEDVDGVEIFVSEGTRKISFEVYGVPSKLKGYVEALRCGEYGFYPISNTKNLGGEKVGLTVKPIEIERGTLYVKEIFQTKTGQQKIMVTFQVSEQYNDSDFGFIPSSEIAADMLGTVPQIEVLVSGSGTATSSGVEDVTLSYVLNNSTVPEPLVGAVLANFELDNLTTSSSVSISGITDNGDGTYEVSYTAQTPGDNLSLDYADGSPIRFTPYEFTEA